jgi:DNA polymerase-4
MAEGGGGDSQEDASPDRPPIADRKILHVDMDAFFAAIEQRDQPKYRGKPLIVGGSPWGRGVVSTCSYEARKFGVHSAMPSRRAIELCPHAIFFPGRMEHYAAVSREIFAIFREVTDLVEPLSIDEAFLDVTGSARLFGPAPEIASRIRREVRQSTGLTISAGVASQKHLAKIASGYLKPDGLTVVPEGGERDFLWPQDLSRLWGAGPATLAKLRAMGLRTVGDLAALSRETVLRRLGPSGLSLWLLANCQDDREVVPQREPKSLAAEETYREDIRGREAAMRELLDLSVKLSRRLRDRGLCGRTLTLKLRDSSFRTRTRSKTADIFLEDHTSIYALARELYPAGEEGPWRLLGLSLGGLSQAGQSGRPGPAPKSRSLFFAGPEKEGALPKADPRLAQAMDRIARRHGSDGLKPATLLETVSREPEGNPSGDAPGQEG